MPSWSRQRLEKGPRPLDKGSESLASCTGLGTSFRFSMPYLYQGPDPIVHLPIMGALGRWECGWDLQGSGHPEERNHDDVFS